MRASGKRNEPTGRRNPARLGQVLKEQLAALSYRRLFVGFSGGLDSSVLLHVAVALNLRPAAIHINHGLHPRADAWERHCGAVCGRLGVEFASRRVSAAGGEGGFRAARYDAFDALLGEGDLLLLGHHRNDQAETVLMRLVRSRSPLAMPRTRRLGGGGRTLKPWLSLTRDDLLRHARAAALDWIDDPSNDEVAFDRNYLRHRVLPVLAERWPDVDRALAAFGEAQAVRDALLTHLILMSGSMSQLAGDDPGGHRYAEPGADTQSTGESHRAADRLEDNWPHAKGRPQIALRAFPGELRLAVLRLWLRGLGEFSVTDRALAEFVRQLDSPADRKPSLSLRHGALRRYRSHVVYDERVGHPSVHIE